MVRIETGMWVVICDGRKWLMFENVGGALAPKLRLIDSLEQVNPATREQGSDAPPRVHESTGHARSAVAQTDWHDEAERKFLADLARRLDGALRAGKTEKMVIAAPPRALGMIRQHYSEQLRSAVRLEVDKDLVKMPVHEIEKMLLGAADKKV